MELYLGIDLAVRAKHRASLVGGWDAKPVWSGRSFTSRATELERLWQAVSQAGERAAAGRQEQGAVRVTVVMEPTRNVWVPLAAWFRARGARVVLVPTTQSAALRDYYKRYAKNDRLDSLVLARLPLHHGQELGEYTQPGPGDPLRRLVRARAGKVKELTAEQQRIDANLDLLGPDWQEAIGTDPGAAALAVLARYGDPRSLLRAGRARLTRFLIRHSGGHWREAKAEEFRAAARASLSLWDTGEGDGLDFVALGKDLSQQAANVIHLREVIAGYNQRMGPLAEAADPQEIIASVPGIGPVLRAVLASRIGDVHRFHSLPALVAFSGLVPKEASSGTSVHQHGLTKAGDPLLREALFRAADGARKIDPQLAARYQRLMHAGAHHNSALCHLAARLLTRIGSCLGNHQQYVIRDLNGQAVTREEGKHLVATRYQVHPEIRQANKTKRQAQTLKGRTGSTPRPATSRVSQESLSAPTTRPANHHDKAFPAA